MKKGQIIYIGVFLIVVLSILVIPIIQKNIGVEEAPSKDATETEQVAERTTDILLNPSGSDKSITLKNDQNQVTLDLVGAAISETYPDFKRKIGVGNKEIVGALIDPRTGNALSLTPGPEYKATFGFNGIPGSTDNGASDYDNVVRLINRWGSNVHKETTPVFVKDYGTLNLEIIAFDYSVESDTDSDFDGLSDAFENSFLSCLNPDDPDGDAGPTGDPDGDGLTNAEEEIQGTNPCDADTDGDGCGEPAASNLANDFRELYIDFTNPTLITSFSPIYDTNGNSIPDCWENLYFGGLLPPGDEDNDDDNDGLTNIQEFQQRTDPQNFDSDFDGYGDATEYFLNINPRSPSHTPSGVTEICWDPGDPAAQPPIPTDPLGSNENPAKPGDTIPAPGGGTCEAACAPPRSDCTVSSPSGSGDGCSEGKCADDCCSCLQPPNKCLDDCIRNAEECETNSHCVELYSQGWTCDAATESSSCRCNPPPADCKFDILDSEGQTTGTCCLTNLDCPSPATQICSFTPGNDCQQALGHCGICVDD